MAPKKHDCPSPAPEDDTWFGTTCALPTQEFAPVPDAIGAGRYAIGELIGTGGMALVYKVLDTKTGTERAIKLLRTQFGDRPTMRRRFVFEARSLARIDHPNVLSVTDAGLVGERLYMVMELIEGGSLSDRIAREGPLPADEALRLTLGVLAGVEAVHRAGLVHRDIKPANVLLGQGGRPLLADLGIAKGERFDALQTETGAAMGTVAFMAPEQVRDAKAVVPASDVYAVGATLCNALTGLLPHQVFLPTVLDELLADHPPAIRALLRRACAYEISARFQTAAEMAEAVERALAGEETPIENDSPPLGDGSGTAGPRPETNLHPRPDSFLGRDDALAELASSIGPVQRLVTITGAGGTGKTRLAEAFALRHIEDYPGGVWFCDLTDARTGQGVCAAVGAALGVPLRGEPIEQLGYAIRGRDRTLVILDNFEQVMVHAEATLGQWISNAPAATFLVTSRRRLGIAGEHLLFLEPLSTTEAMRLFESRVAAARPEFTINDENEALVQEISERLDCIPLALEMAAARVRSMSLQQLRDRLSQRFRLLRGQRRDRAARQATLSATIGWSWALLEPWEQLALSQCAVFHGGFTLEAIEDVLDLSAFPDAPWPMDAIAALVDHSLVVPRTPRPSHERFAVYESIREYALERAMDPTAVLAPDGRPLTGPDALSETRARHLSYFAHFGTGEYITSLSIHGGSARWWALHDDLDNLDAATAVGCASGLFEEAAGCVLALTAISLHAGPFEYALDLASQVSPYLPPGQLRRRVDAIRGRLHQRAGQVDAAREI